MVSLDISVSVSLVSVGPSILLCNQIVREGLTPFDYMLYHSHSFLNFASMGGYLTFVGQNKKVDDFS